MCAVDVRGFQRLNFSLSANYMEQPVRESGRNGQLSVSACTAGVSSTRLPMNSGDYAFLDRPSNRHFSHRFSQVVSSFPVSVTFIVSTQSIANMFGI